MDKRLTFLTALILLLVSAAGVRAQQPKGASVQQPTSATNPENPLYLNNRAPLKSRPYLQLPLGAIRPEGWLKDQLLRMKTGLTGHLDQRYAAVVGSRNAWLGGDGDAWERGPYWIDGLLPLAYILNDKELIAKVQPWVEWTLTHQREDGYIGPPLAEGEITPEAGLQKTMREDWWPRMVMLKVLQQYYSATQDPRVIDVLTRYFRYQLSQLPEHPLDHWTFWANRRGADNLMVVYWLYNLTGESFLLELGELLHQQTFPYARVFLNEYKAGIPGVGHLYPYNVNNRYPFNQELINRLHVGQSQSFHCVNLAQGIKAPVIYYQQNPDSLYLKAVKQAFDDIRIFHGQAQGMYGGDEAMHGNAPTQGIEFCSVVELMFSLENMLAITGDVEFAARLEKIAYNALPTQATDDFNNRQYFQSANQVLLTRNKRNFFVDDFHGGTDLCFGLLTGYPCCTTNMHQGWPKFVQNLWYASADNGLAALVYGPSHVEAKVAGGVPVSIREETSYPFEETIRFTVETPQAVGFPLHLRIPEWAEGATVTINGTPWNGQTKPGQTKPGDIKPGDTGPGQTKSGRNLKPGDTGPGQALKPGGIIRISRTWDNGDQVVLRLPMRVRTSRWVQNSAAVERGPLVYALRIEEEWKPVDGTDHFGDYVEVYPRSDWNFGLLTEAVENPGKYFKVVERNTGAAYPWNLENAPVELVTNGKQLERWELYNHMPGPLPHNRLQTQDLPAKEIRLVPYGCSTLRITQFPVIN